MDTTAIAASPAFSQKPVLPPPVWYANEESKGMGRLAATVIVIVLVGVFAGAVAM